jgi:hypothetical protein
LCVGAHLVRFLPRGAGLIFIVEINV